MILTKFSSNTLIRASAILSVLLGLLYLPSKYALPIPGLGPELAGAQQITEVWGVYALCGGVGIFLGSFLLNLDRSIIFKRVILVMALLAIFLLIVAQLLPLFWWLFLGVGAFSWSSVLGFFLHFSLLILAMWGAIVTIYAFEQLKTSK